MFVRIDDAVKERMKTIMAVKAWACCAKNPHMKVPAIRIPMPVQNMKLEFQILFHMDSFFSSNWISPGLISIAWNLGRSEYSDWNLDRSNCLVSTVQ